MTNTSTVTHTTTEISLAKLVPSPANARRTGAGLGIEALAVSIQAHGLLQSLVPSRLVWKLAERRVSSGMVVGLVTRRGQRGRGRRSSRPRSANR